MYKKDPKQNILEKNQMVTKAPKILFFKGGIFRVFGVGPMAIATLAFAAWRPNLSAGYHQDIG